MSNSIQECLEQKEKAIAYYNNLEMEAKTTLVHKHYLKVTSSDSLVLFREILGDGIGIGLAKDRPTKRNPLGYCTINSILTSVEVPDDVPDNALHQGGDGIYLIFTEQKRLLTCNIRFSNIIVSSTDDALSRLPHARVEEEEAQTAAYVSAWFLYNGVLHEVVRISDNIATCKKIGNYGDSRTLNLSTALVSESVKSFGSSFFFSLILEL